MEHIELNSVSWMGHKHNMAETGKKSLETVFLFSSTPLTNSPALK